jgi:hypothetical protein
MEVTDMTMNPAVDIKGKGLLNSVEKGMLVFDRAGHEIGKIDGTFMPAETDNLAGTSGKSELLVAPAAIPVPVAAVGASASMALPADPSGLLPADDTFPKVLRDRLLNNGFVRIHAGLLHHHRYAMPHQIEAVDSGRVRLSVDENDLIKR